MAPPLTGDRQSEVVSLWGSPFRFDHCHGKSVWGRSSSQSNPTKVFMNIIQLLHLCRCEHQASPPITPKQTATLRKTWPSICQPTPMTTLSARESDKGLFMSLVCWLDRIHWQPMNSGNKYIKKKKKEICKSLKLENHYKLWNMILEFWHNYKAFATSTNYYE